MDAALPVAGPYAAPALAFAGETAETDDVIWWIVVVGFAYAIALAWATWCRHNGGSAEVSFGWTGFKVVCRAASADSSTATSEGRAALCRPPTRASTTAALDAAGVCKRFGGTPALASVDLRVAAGSVVGLVGPNGSGKTTLLRAAAGLVEIDEGSILVAGVLAGSPPARAATALVPDEPQGFDELTGTEFTSLVHTLWGAGDEAGARTMSSPRHSASVIGSSSGSGPSRVVFAGRSAPSRRSRWRRRSSSSTRPPPPSTRRPSSSSERPWRRSRPVAAPCCSRRRTCTSQARRATRSYFSTAARSSTGARPRHFVSRHAAESLEDAFLAALGDCRLRARVRDAFRAL